MTSRNGSFTLLYPEIYPVIATHLPLHATPSTLLSLAQTSRDISHIVLPLLHTRLILKNETDALLVLQKLESPVVGLAVRELHILSGLSYATRQQDPPADVVTRTVDIISRGNLPFLHTLDVQLTNEWRHCGPGSDQVCDNSLCVFPRVFWTRIKEYCPRLRGIVLKGIQYPSTYGSETEDLGFLHVPGITSLSITFLKKMLPPPVYIDMLVGPIMTLAPLLHTLELGVNPQGFVHISPLFDLNLPYLRSLSLKNFTQIDTLQTTAFFERHPSIQYLNLNVAPSDVALASTSDCWFTAEISEGFLPNLRHLRAHWKDVRRLAPILAQLLSLCIHGSVNAQVPFLLRFTLPDGLPYLKSLDIGQFPRRESANYRNIDVEGSTIWYEDADDGMLRAYTPEQPRTIFDNYMHSIVRAAPRLEELGFHGADSPLADFIAVADDLNGFCHLKRLYYIDRATGAGEPSDTFGELAGELAELVPRLEAITNVGAPDLPYQTAEIHRDPESLTVELCEGFGMQTGNDDEAFPWAPQSSVNVVVVPRNRRDLL
ncbi:hypothetical protein HYPSUDRAFT_418319 [Hypholoma sublateritium FD-334 SS-4]|uniref:F-box domain-containing protein n=1 Tax=Hypholoma sublateritium (strain FD-334 SS-4) TaxID=945553 RepID=A0A0D2P2U6_HYPSF|nr:hypothetical protein HYPSUDRAFT_418319 [Hypholoma sublateritium FD-334 SS-4]